MTKLGQKLTTLILSVLLVVTAVVGITWGYKPTANATESIINPIAKYEFKDASNLGKDTMGNYDMVTKTITGATGTPTLLDGGGITYDRNLYLSQTADKNMFADVSAFTITFEVKTAAGTGDWDHYLGVSQADSGDGFAFIGRGRSYPGQMRLDAYNFRRWNGGSDNILNVPKIPFASGETVAPTEFQKIVVTVQPGGNMSVYLNGNNVVLKNTNASLKEWDTSIDSTWSTGAKNALFTIGAREPSTSVTSHRASAGSIRNVRLYDFAMTSENVSAFNTNGELYKSDVANFTYVNPIAKYEFKDASNLGKDTMGNYDMEYRNKYVVGGEGELLNTYTSVDEVNGGVTFDGQFCLSQDKDSNMFADVSAFTLCFEIKTGKGRAEWEQYIGVGNADGDGFAFIGRMPSLPGQMRLQTYNMLSWDGGNSDVYNAPKIPFATGESVAPTEYQRVVVSVQPGGNMLVYLNGKLVALTNPQKNKAWDTSIDETWATATKNSFFAIGGRYNGAVDKMATGSIRNVQFYDFAMDATCVKSYDRTGVVNTAHLSNLNTITSVGEVELDGEITSEQLNDGMTADEMLSKVNDASAVVTLSDGSTTSATITWTEVITDGEKYFVKGSANTSKLGYANLCGYEVSYELPVVELPKVVGAIKGASVSAMGDFGLNFYVTMAQDTQNVTATMVMDGNETTVNGVYVEKEGAWLFAYPVAAKDFDKNVTLTITEVNGVAVDNGVTTTYSVKAYADNVANMELGGVVTQELKDLANALNNYCQQTKIYFANEGEVVKETNGVVSSSDLEKYASVKGGSDDNATIVGASLILESKTRIHVYFKSTGQIQCFVNGNEVTAQAVEGQDGLYVIAIEVLAQNLDDMFEIQIGGLTLNYGAFTYIRNCIDVVDAPLYNTLQALYDYGMAANNYFN